MYQRRMHAIIGVMVDNKTHIVDETRDFHFDNIKAVLIFLVVLGHVFRNLGANGDEYLVYKIIYSFHMPAFLFVSGYFMKYNPKKFFARLVPLYLLFQTIQTLEHMLLAFANGLDPMDVKMDLFTPRWTLWYLVVLMIYQLLIPLIDTNRKKHQLGFLILSVVLGLTIGFTDDTDNFFALSRAFVFLPFFLLGFYERKNHYMITYGTGNRPRLSKLVSAAAGGVMIIFFWKFAGKIDPKDFFGSEDYADLNAFLWRLFGWLFACVWIMILLNWVPKKNAVQQNRTKYNVDLSPARRASDFVGGYSVKGYDTEQYTSTDSVVCGYNCRFVMGKIESDAPKGAGADKILISAITG